jgi:hypothetical protein
MFYNTDSGLYLTLYRAYDPVAGRWLSRDPIGEMGNATIGATSWARYYNAASGRFGFADPTGLTAGVNLYDYVGGNPISKTDPNGDQIPQVLLLGVVALINFETFIYNLNPVSPADLGPPVPPPPSPLPPRMCTPENPTGAPYFNPEQNPTGTHFYPEQVSNYTPITQSSSPMERPPNPPRWPIPPQIPIIISR